MIWTGEVKDKELLTMSRHIATQRGWILKNTLRLQRVYLSLRKSPPPQGQESTALGRIWVKLQNGSEVHWIALTKAGLHLVGWGWWVKNHSCGLANWKNKTKRNKIKILEGRVPIMLKWKKKKKKKMDWSKGKKKKRKWIDLPNWNNSASELFMCIYVYIIHI